MRAEDQKIVKGIYCNKQDNKVYFVNEVKLKTVNVSTVSTERHLMIDILNDRIEIYKSVFKNFIFCGDYRRTDITEL